MFPSNPRRMYESYRYNWQQQNSSRVMASAIEVPLRDATPYVVPSLHFPHNNDRRMYESYRYNWQQQNSSRGMASAVEVPLRDATPSVVPSLHYPHNNDRRMYESYRDNWQQQNSSRGMASAVEVPLRDATPSVVSLHYFPHESSPPALTDITTQSDESMVSFSKMTWGTFAFWLLLMNEYALYLIIRANFKQVWNFKSTNTTHC